MSKVLTPQDRFIEESMRLLAEVQKLGDAHSAARRKYVDFRKQTASELTGIKPGDKLIPFPHTINPDVMIVEDVIDMGTSNVTSELMFVARGRKCLKNGTPGRQMMATPYFFLSDADRFKIKTSNGNDSL